MARYWSANHGDAAEYVIVSSDAEAEDVADWWLVVAMPRFNECARVAESYWHYAEAHRESSWSAW